MQYELTDQGDSTTLRINGRLTFADSESYKRALEEVERLDRPTWVVDLENLTFIDSFGLGLLLLTYDQAAKHRRKVVFRKPSGIVRERLDYAKFESILTIEG